MASINLNWKWLYWSYGFTWANDLLPQILENGLKENQLDRSVYVIRLNGPFAIQYPYRATSLLYIGEGNFKQRINSHTKGWLNDLWEIIENHGLTIGVATPRVRNNLSAYKDVEAALIHEFSNLYGTAPINNKQYEYSRLDHNFEVKELREALTIGRGIKHKWAISPMKANKFYHHYHRTHV
ncbi:hypothetical protein [Shewanella salipaludis]|uniref:Uncharacterized protein n=1 Tax=Shewanella salipaludis TaxID=2723052 RepID=A0A972FQD5_9GAMM|nr:hypothetical protein [Shewanella salipaludis]NMH63822.1 hypothetical protein [Shewanella salipaludis]